MIELRFQIVDESVFTVDAPENESPATVEHSLFECPVFCVVDGTNLLGSPAGGTTALPLIGFGPRALQRLRLLQPGGADQITISDSGWMYFKEYGGRVHFSTSRVPFGGEVSVHEALAAFERFAGEVKEVIAARVPRITRHPQWKYWFLD